MRRRAVSKPNLTLHGTQGAAVAAPLPDVDKHAAVPALSVLRQFIALTKPRVIQLIVFCALIGMVLAVPLSLIHISEPTRPY